jgi:hypothetical protein
MSARCDIVVTPVPFLRQGTNGAEAITKIVSRKRARSLLQIRVIQLILGEVGPATYVSD